MSPKSASPSWLVAVAGLVVLLICAAPQAVTAVDWSPRNGPEGGYVVEVVVDPTDSNIAYLANYAGVHKTTNGGASWTNLNAYWGALSTIRIDPASHNTVYLVSGRIIRSTDGGANWTVLNTENSCTDVVKNMVIDLKSSSTLYAIMTPAGQTPDYYVVKSTNGGDTWTRMAWKASALAIDPSSSNTLYATTTTGIQKSTDGGSTWSPAGSGLPSAQTLKTVVIDPKTPSNLYLAATAAIYKSTNGGGSWQPASDATLSGAKLEDPVIDPLTPSNLYVVATTTGNLGTIYKTSNGGGQWAALNLGITDASAQVVAVDPLNPTTLYTGTFVNGVLKSTNSGTSWTTRNTGLKALLQHMALDAANKNIIYAGIPGLGVFQSTDGGNTWGARNAGLASLMVSALAISPVGNRTLWVAVNSGINPGVYKSTNGGSSWTAANNPLDNFGFLAPLKMVADPVNPNGIYALGFVGGVYRSSDGGSTWNSSRAGFPANTIPNALAIDPKTPTTLYAGIYATTGGTPLVYKSTNGGVDWVASSSGLPGAQGIFDLAVDPKTPSTLYAAVILSTTVNGGIFKSIDSAGGWQDTTLGLQSPIAGYSDPTYGNLQFVGPVPVCPSPPFVISAFNISIDPATPTTVFAVVDGFVLRTTNSAATWSIAHTGLPFVPYQIGVSPADSTAVYVANQGIYVYTGTGGGGGGGGTTNSLSVTSPNGGESWVAGSAHNITWTSTGTIANVKIEVSTDGGGTYSTVAASTANTGSYSWTVPSTAATACKVRVSDAAAATVSDTSDANFTITATSGCSYSLNPSSRSFSTSGGTGSVSVAAGSGCAWTAVSNVPWITITSGASGNGNGTVNFTVAATSTSRNGTITIGGQTFTVTQSPSTGISTDLFIPIALSSSGVGGSFYTTETTFTNRGTSTAQVDLTYTAAFGGGSGTATLSLPPGQTVVSDEIAHLRSLGVPLPDSGNRGGTLRARISNLSSASAASVIARTATEVRNGSGELIGRAGLAYAAIPITSSSASGLTDGGVSDGQPNRANLTLPPTAATGALQTSSYICGLRQNDTDRSNVAFQNVGSASDGNITLRVTVFDGNSSFSQALPLVVLEPGGFFQISGVLASNGLSLSSGYVKIDRMAGTAAYYAYGVINDQGNSDGSFVAPQPASSSAVGGLTLPVIVQTSSFLSELVLANVSSQARNVNFSFVADAVTTADKTARFSINIPAGGQQIIPDIFAYMRDNAVAGIGPAGTTLAGALFATATGGDISGVVLGARTSAPSTSVSGRFGLFYTAVPYGQASTSSAWLFGLQQNSENRTNLAIVNTGETDGSADTFVIDLYDGATGAKVKTLDPIVLNARGWIQIGTILVNAPGVTQGYAEVRRTSGNNPFVTYAVTNDGSGPGLRTGDGAYIGSSQ